MVSISPAGSVEDFEIAAGLCSALADWDASEAPPYGISPDEVRALFHGETAASLRAKYNSADSRLFIARSDGSPAGCFAFSPFDETTVEFHKFFVDGRLRGRGIGSLLMRTVLAEAQKGYRRTAFIHTTVYMTGAISIYRSFDFIYCPPFRPTPEHIRHTDVFMSRRI